MNLIGHVRKIKGGAVPPSKYKNTSNFGEIWIIYVNLQEKNNEIGQNSLGVHVRGVWGAVAPVKNSNTSDFGEIWTIYQKGLHQSK